MYEIKLFYNNHVALVDDEDFEVVNSLYWRLKTSKRTHYAISEGHNGILMHRFIMKPPVNNEVHHKNGNGLDNQRHNLIITSKLENGQHQKMSTRNISGVRGVSYNMQSHGWEARITVYGVTKQLGTFSDKDDAVAARLNAEQKYRRQL